MKKRSWRTTMTVLMIAILLCMLGFTLWSASNYYLQIQQTYQQENRQAAVAWSNMTSSRLAAAKEHIYELLLTIYDSPTSLQSTDPMPFSLRKECADAMDNKISANSDISFFFVYDRDSEIMVFSAVKGSSATKVLAAKEYVRDGEFSLSSIKDSTWDVVLCGGENYFVKAVSLGKYTVGAMCRVTNFDAMEDLHVLGREASFLMCHNDAMLYVGGENWTQEVSPEAARQDGSWNGMWIAAAPLPAADSTMVLAVRQYGYQDMLTSSMFIFLTMGGMCIVLFVILMLQMQKYISVPTKILLESIRQIQEGHLNYRIAAKAGTEEFDALFGNFNDMVDQIHNLRIEAYDRELQKQKDELTMLRAQIRPHFYLNAITTVSNMTYQNRQEDIREYLRALAQYMRYMLNVKDRQIPLGSEVEQIRNYLQMQKIRFPDSVDAFIGCSSQVQDTPIPYLLVFTVVENTFKHAMSLYTPLRLLVQCESVETENFRGCRIIVEDNGKGFPPEVLEDFRPGKGIPEAKDHIGLTNVSRTLQLVYHREDLLRLSNAPTGGAHVEVWIPRQEEKEKEASENEASDMR